MAARPTIQFSLTGLLLCLVLISAAFGGLIAVLREQQQALRAARFQALERMVGEVHGNIIGYRRNSQAPIAIDLMGAEAECQWIEKWLKLSGNAPSPLIIVDAAFAERVCFGDLRKQFPEVVFVVAQRSVEGVRLQETVSRE